MRLHYLIAQHNLPIPVTCLTKEVATLNMLMSLCIQMTQLGHLQWPVKSGDLIIQ